VRVVAARTPPGSGADERRLPVTAVLVLATMLTPTLLVRTAALLALLVAGAVLREPGRRPC
jgi:hypothetical protein